MTKVFTICFIIGVAFSGCGSPAGTPREKASIVSAVKPFTEGVIEMSIFTQGVNVGKLTRKIDYSKNNLEQQIAELMKTDKDAKTMFEAMQKASAKSPIAGLAMAFNISECTYYIKDDIVLGRATGLGWTMDNYHNQGKDEGSLYLETMAKGSRISKQDQKIYALYTPSQNRGRGAISDIDFAHFDRKPQDVKQDVSGYACDVITYAPRKTEPSAPMQVYKLIVYTSPSFNNTINYTHPFYLKEPDGILRIDIYLTDADTPTLIMQPTSIKARSITADELTSRTATPVYTVLEGPWVFKALAIMMSGGIMSDH